MPDSPASLWAATAAAGPLIPVLSGDHSADVLVIGAGFTGLTAALALAEGGAAVTVLEAAEVGFGASGRNGGQVIPGLKYDPDTLDRLFGPATTDFVGRAADSTFALIKRLEIDCGAQATGWVQATVKTRHLPTLAARMEAWRRRGAPAELLDGPAMAKATGSRGFVGGWLDHRAGVVHPLNYVRGLARAVLAAGGRIYGQSRVTVLRRDGGRWIATTATGQRLTADQVVIGTNGYTDRLWPGLKATVIPASSFQVATAPLPPALRAQLLPRIGAVSDTRRLANYFRIGPGDRLMIGGRGSFSEPRGPAAYRRIEAALHHFFPELAGVAIDYRWTGRIAMTRDHLPHLHQPAPGLTIALGYNGRGVAMASSLGLAIGRHLLDRQQPLPLSISAIKPLPVHDLHPLYATGMIWLYRLQDALEK